MFHLIYMISSLVSNTCLVTLYYHAPIECRYTLKFPSQSVPAILSASRSFFNANIVTMTHQNGSNDLASILQVLSSYAPPQATMQSEATELEEGEYDPNEYDPKQHQLVSSVQYSERQTSPTHHQLATPKKSVSDESKPPVPPQTPSPASIKTWPQALLHAVTYVCPNPEKTKRIQHLMDTQHQHERQWWEQRQEIIRKAKGRDASRVRLDSVL